MKSTSPEPSDHSAAGSPCAQPVYVIRDEDLRSYVDDQMSLLELWRVLWQEKWLVVMITAVFVVVSITYSLTATKWYRAEVLMAPSEGRSTQVLPGALAGLASIAGVNVGGGDSAQALAVMQSRDFTREFIEDQKLLPVLYADSLDHETGGWKAATEPPDIRDAIAYFDRSVRRISQDRTTRLVTLTIEWKDPKAAAEWANLLIKRLNARMRERALVEAQANVDYLQEQLSKTSVVALQQSIGRLIEIELQKLMLARGNEEFAFRVIDEAQVPKSRSRPRRTLIVALSAVAGGMLGAFLALIRNAIRRALRHTNTQDSEH